MRQKHFQRLLILLSKILSWLPDKWIQFSCEELPVVCPASQVHLFGIYLIWNVYQHNIEIVVRVMVWLVKNFDFVCSVGFDSTSRRHIEEWLLLRLVFNSLYLRDQLKVNREATNIRNLEALVSSLSDEYIGKRKKPLFRSYGNLWSHTCTLQVDRNHSGVRIYHDSFFVDLLS